MVTFRFFASLTDSRDGSIADLDLRRRDARDVEPIRAVKDLLPIHIAGLCQRDSRVGTVIDGLTRKLVCACFQIKMPIRPSRWHPRRNDKLRAARNYLLALLDRDDLACAN